MAAHAERMTGQLLTDKGYEVFFPTFRQRKQWSDRVKVMHAPLFPRYLFCRSIISVAGYIITTPGVIKILGVNGRPTPVDEMEMTAMKKIVLSGFPLHPHKSLQVGDMVTIRKGPLAGISGRIIRKGNGLRLVVTVQMIEKSIVVTLPNEYVS